MENKVLSSTVPAPPVTRYYQNNYSSEIAMGRALTKNGQEWSTQNNCRFQTQRKQESGETETVMDRCCSGRYEKFWFPKMVDGHWLQEAKAYCGL